MESSSAQGPAVSRPVPAPEVVGAATALRWTRPDLTGALAEHLMESAAAAADRDAWLVAAGWRVHAAAAVSDGRETASDVLESLPRWGDGALGAAAGSRLRLELAVLGRDAGEATTAQPLLDSLPGDGADPELLADVATARLRCSDGGPLDPSAALAAWAHVGGAAGLIGTATALLVTAAADRRLGRPAEAVRRSVDGLGRLDRARASTRSLSPSPHLAAALAAEWISSLIGAGRSEQAHEGSRPLRQRLVEHARPTRQLALLRLTLTRVAASEAGDADEDVARELERAAHDAAACDAPELEHICRTALAEVHDSAGRTEAAAESARLAVVADRRHRARAARFRAALASLPVAAVRRTASDVRGAQEEDRSAAEQRSVNGTGRRRAPDAEPSGAGGAEPRRNTARAAGVGSSSERTAKLRAVQTASMAEHRPPDSRVDGGRPGRRRRLDEDGSGVRGSGTGGVSPLSPEPSSNGQDGPGRAAGTVPSGVSMNGHSAHVGSPGRDGADERDGARREGAGERNGTAGRDGARGNGSGDRLGAIQQDGARRDGSGERLGADEQDGARRDGAVERDGAADDDRARGSRGGRRIGADEYDGARRDGAAAHHGARRDRAGDGYGRDDVGVGVGVGEGNGAAASIGPGRALDPWATGVWSAGQAAAVPRRARRAAPEESTTPLPGQGAAEPVATGAPGNDHAAVASALADPEAWLASALADLDRIWGRRADEPVAGAERSDGPRAEQEGDPAPECVVVVDLARAGVRLPADESAPTVRRIARRLAQRLPESGELRRDTPDAVSVVLADGDRAAAAEWMRRVVPALVDGLAVDAAVQGAQLRAAVHDRHGVVGAQVLQRLDGGRSRPPTAPGPARHASGMTGLAATGSARSGSADTRHHDPRSRRHESRDLGSHGHDGHVLGDADPDGPDAGGPDLGGQDLGGPDLFSHILGSSDPDGRDLGGRQSGGQDLGWGPDGQDPLGVDVLPHESRDSRADRGTGTDAAGAARSVGADSGSVEPDRGADADPTDGSGRHDRTGGRRPYLPDGVIVRPGSGGRRHRRGEDRADGQGDGSTPESGRASAAASDSDARSSPPSTPDRRPSPSPAPDPEPGVRPDPEPRPGRPSSTEGMGLADLLAGALAAYRGI